MPREGHDRHHRDGEARRQEISIHVPREGHDKTPSRIYTGPILFQSTCPARGTTSLVCDRGERLAISIHVPREGHDLPGVLWPPPALAISIHVPREGHDASTTSTASTPSNFNPRAPRGARRSPPSRPGRHAADFNPRAPRGARRVSRQEGGVVVLDFNPRAPRGARQWRRSSASTRLNFNPRAPRGARPGAFFPTSTARIRFQSTCPARGTTANMHNFFVQICARVTNIPLKGMPYLQKTYVSI